MRRGCRCCSPPATHRCNPSAQMQRKVSAHTPAYGSTTNDRGYMSDGRPRRHHGLQARQRAMDRKASGGAARRGARLTVSIDPKLTLASKLGVQLLLEELGTHLIEDDKNTRSARSSRNTCTHGRTGRGQLMQDVAISCMHGAERWPTAGLATASAGLRVVMGRSPFPQQPPAKPSSNS